ncbi:uncharacterized protein LAJ45_03049 [Morchella importuna]|uniref:uncharacterized protein n=1 Tax=Morchella importuna TaxID=1174673 RepID=UPI001E8E8FB9|nr:uncharacterized protein LAJ45_03049 [Morchella importuna]KAH8152823.1 hypothetical protein LAJ45_03049 [Morchella importuna]
MLHLLSILALTGISTASAASTCKSYPNTPSWPSRAKWDSLNSTVSGRLIAAIPPAASCHKKFKNTSTYDPVKCELVTANWGEQDSSFNHPVGVLWDFWTNITCLPTTNPEERCSLGTYPEYVINATTVEDVQAGVNFARLNNVRLVIKNTGHDFMGKSTGAGSLSIWTHHFKEIEIIDSYSDPSTTYNGSAVTLGSGWQTASIYNALDVVGKVIVGGECAGVGFSGGYIQGGGHGPLSPLHGMAVDNVLQFKLVTADGLYKTADAHNNSDLFWALRGGGGSSWGVVTSVTVKTFPTPMVSGAVIELHYDKTTPEIFWEGINIFHSFAPQYAEAGIYGYYEINANSFLLKPLLATGKTTSELTEILSPLFTSLDTLGVPYTATITTYPTFLSGYNSLFDGEAAGLNMFTSSRLILHEHVIANHTAVTQAFRLTTEAGLGIIGHLVAPGQFGGVLEETSVNPIWKTGLLLPLYNHFWLGNETDSDFLEGLDLIADVDAAFKEVSPGSGTYVNEANAYDPDWAKEYYGASYERLLRIKKNVDPHGVFYARTAVGSELWAEANGRLCRA